MMFSSPPLDIHAQALELALHGNVQAKGQPAIFTSCRRTDADTHAEQNPNTTLIHYTDAGAALEQANLFSHMPHKLAYLYWFILSARYVLENDFPEKTLLFGDIANASSTAFNLETPLLMLTKPNVTVIVDGITGTQYPRADWLEANLVRTYLLDNRAFSDDSPAHVLFKIFNTASGVYSEQDLTREIDLKNILRGILQKHLPTMECAQDRPEINKP
jgi:hypothetical protein